MSKHHFAETPRNGEESVSADGIRMKRVNGETLLCLDDLEQWLIKQIPKLIGEADPVVKQAKDCRAIIQELLHGIGGEMETFQANVKLYLEDIRQTRFSMVSETAQMTKHLGEIRQFFIGKDYGEQIQRLREFVDLCERLARLKESGFLDRIADTMLKLD